MKESSRHLTEFFRDSILSGSIQDEERFDKLDENAKLLYEAIKNDRDLWQDQYIGLRNALNQQLGQANSLYAETSEKIHAALERIERLYAKSVNQHGQGLNGGQYLTTDPKVHEQAVIGALLRSISYPNIDSRGESIATAHAKTYEWALEETHEQQQIWSNLNKWLRSQDGIYWLSGKAASGKSTLMKFLTQNKKTEKALKAWAGLKPLVIASFFFWSTGTTMQKSQAGLLRSLLLQAVKQHPLLIRVVMPELGQALFDLDDRTLSTLSDSWYSWSLVELKKCFERLRRQTQFDIRICFFIDGLDEFAGDPVDLIQTFKDLSTCSWIKLCLSSRPVADI